MRTSLLVLFSLLVSSVSSFAQPYGAYYYGPPRVVMQAPVVRVCEDAERMLYCHDEYGVQPYYYRYREPSVGGAAGFIAGVIIGKALLGGRHQRYPGW